MKLDARDLQRLAEVLDIFERNTAYETGVRGISGGYANADMFNYDDDYIDIELRWGVQSDVEDTMHTEQYKLKTSLIAGREHKPVDIVQYLESA